MSATHKPMIVAEALLELLGSSGINYFFGNSGTDFAPIIEAFAKRQGQGQDKPVPVTVPHEITAVAMAHGYTMVTGQPQAVMVHVIVGTANALHAIIHFDLNIITLSRFFYLDRFGHLASHSGYRRLRFNL